MDINDKYLYEAELIRVIDGDTIDAWIDLGFNITVRRRIRLWGIDAPETRTLDLEEKAEGKIAKARLEEMLSLNRGSFLIKSNLSYRSFVIPTNWDPCPGKITENIKKISKNLLFLLY